MIESEGDRRAALIAWVQDVTGEPRASLRVRPGGGRHGAWDVEVDSEPRWFLRVDFAPPAAHEHYTLRREATVYRAVHDLGIPCPAVIAVHPTIEAILLEHVAGDAGFARLDATTRTTIIDDFAPHLARLHAADPSTMDLEGLMAATTIDQAVVNELDIWEQRLDAGGFADPFLTACFRWLRANIPHTGETRPSLVQGDTGPGNFLHDGSRVTAILDFELAHVGDPMEDLAWVGTRNAQEPVPDFEGFLSAYAAAGGALVDRPRLRYHLLFAELRIAVLSADRGHGGSDALAEHGNQIIYGTLPRRLTVEALAAAAGVDVPAVELPQLTDTSDTRFYEGVLAQLAEIVVPAIGDPFARRRAKSMARVVKYLRDADRAGNLVDAELDDLTVLLGHRPASVTDGVEQLHDAVMSGRLDAVDLLPHAAGQAFRRQHVAAAAMGVLARQHLPVV